MSRVSDKSYFLYDLWSESSARFYIGITVNLAHRLEQHNSGVCTWTSKFRPWKIVHAESYATYRNARMREIQLKKQKGAFFLS